MCDEVDRDKSRLSRGVQNQIHCERENKKKSRDVPFHSFYALLVHFTNIYESSPSTSVVPNGVGYPHEWNESDETFLSSSNRPLTITTFIRDTYLYDDTHS